MGLQRDFKETSKRLQRDFKQTPKRLQRDFKDTSNRLQTDFKEIVGFLTWSKFETRLKFIKFGH